MPPLIRLVSLIAVFCILASIALIREHTLFGHSYDSKQPSELTTQSAQDQCVINTSLIGQNISGYNGPVPLEIHITNGRIDSVSALPNHETPSFFKRAESILQSWDGLTLQEALNKRVDAVSGATFSSNAIIENMHAGIAEAANRDTELPAESASDSLQWSAKYTIAFIIALSAAVCPLFIRSRKYRMVQQLLNVGVLGFWAGTFLDYSLFIKTFAYGIPVATSSLLTILMFIVAFVYPIFGKKNHYCSWICPFGSLQELAGKTKMPKIHISPETLKKLRIAKTLLWCVLMLCLWSGVMASWIDYEIFTAFIVESASTVVIVIGGLFTVLSIFIMRPFCRFVCPVGTLLNISEGRMH